MSEPPGSDSIASEISLPARPSVPEGGGPSGTPVGPPAAFEGQFQATYSPYLTADDLEAYSRISPAIMRRILEHNIQCIDRANEEARVQAEHRRTCDNAALSASVKDREEARTLQRRGQWFAISAVGIVFSVVLAGFVCGQGWPSAAVGTPVLAGIILASFLGHGLTGNHVAAAPEPPRPRQNTHTN